MTIHIATSAEIGKAVRRGLRLPVSVVSDNLLVGPCASDPEAHLEQRCDFWGLLRRDRTRFRTSFRGLVAAVQSPQPVVVWASPLWSDTAALWGLCAWRLGRGRDEPDLDLVMLGDAADAGFGRGSLGVTPAGARGSMGAARALSRSRVQEMARWWRKLSGRSPVLSAEREPARRERAALVDLGTYQAGFFPRMSGRGLALSRFDEVLFSCLDRQWSTPVDVFVRRSPAGEELRKWLTMTGDVFLAMRLRRWATHQGAGAALESEPCQPGNVMRDARYRLSDAGDEIRRDGLAEMGRGAPLPIWGVVAYDPLDPWVVTDEPGVGVGRVSVTRPPPHAAR